MSDRHDNLCCAHCRRVYILQIYIVDFILITVQYTTAATTTTTTYGRLLCNMPDSRFDIVPRSIITLQQLLVPQQYTTVRYTTSILRLLYLSLIHI